MEMPARATVAIRLPFLKSRDARHGASNLQNNNTNQKSTNLNGKESMGRARPGLYFGEE